jgi:hypothetical protein
MQNNFSPNVEFILVYAKNKERLFKSKEGEESKFINITKQRSIGNGE